MNRFKPFYIFLLICGGTLVLMTLIITIGFAPSRRPPPRTCEVPIQYIEGRELQRLTVRNHSGNLRYVWVERPNIVFWCERCGIIGSTWGGDPNNIDRELAISYR